MKRIHAADRVGEPVGDRPGDPAGHVAGHQFDLFAARFAERVEERLDGLAVTTGRGPHQPAGVVIDDDGQIALTLAMRDLVDPDPAQTVEKIGLALGFDADAFADRADRPPRDTHQLGDRRLARVHRKPRGLVLERAREPRVVPGPRHRADHDAVTAARHPRRRGLDERQRRAEIQRTPPTAPVAEVIARAASPTHPAALTLAPDGPDRNDDLSHPGFGGDLETRTSVLERGTVCHACTQEVPRRAQGARGPLVFESERPIAQVATIWASIRKSLRIVGAPGRTRRRRPPGRPDERRA